MKFRFVGGLDCPDWVLAEIPQFSKVPKNTFKHVVKDILERLLSGEINFNGNEINEMQDSAGLHSETLKGQLAALGFILEKSAKNKCAPNDLAKEMLQLGMAFDHTDALSSVYESEFTKLSERLSERFPRHSSLSIRKKEEIEGEKVKTNIYTMIESNEKTFKLGISEQQKESLKQEMKRALETLSVYI